MKGNIEDILNTDDISSFLEYVRGKHNNSLNFKVGEFEPVLVASSRGTSNTILRYVIENGGSIELSEIEWAARIACDFSAVDSLELLFSKVDDVGGFINSAKSCFLEIAVKKSTCTLTEYLLGRGADQNTTQKYAQRPPIWWACRMGYLEQVKLLMTADIPPDLKKKSVKAILSPAAENGSLHILKYLIVECGFKLKPLGPYKNQAYEKPPLVEAILKGHRECIDFLISEGAPLIHGKPPSVLMEPAIAAVISGDLETLQVFKSMGVDLTSDGLLSMALHKKQQKVADYLKSIS